MQRMLFGSAAAVSAFGVLFAQAPSSDHVPDLIIWLIAASLFLASVGSGWRKSKTKPSAVLWLILAAGGFLFSIPVIIDILQHLHSL